MPTPTTEAYGQNLRASNGTPVQANLIKALDEGVPCPPTFRDAYETAKVCDAVLDSAKDRAWKDV